MMCKKGSTFSRDDFPEKELRRSGAFGSWVVVYSIIKALDVFGKEHNYNNIDEYLLGIKAELKEEPESDAPMMLLDDFASSHTKIGKIPVTVKAYVSKIKKYVRLVHSIRLSKEDIQDCVTMPVEIESDEE